MAVKPKGNVVVRDTDHFALKLQNARYFDVHCIVLNAFRVNNKDKAMKSFDVVFVLLMLHLKTVSATIGK